MGSKPYRTYTAEFKKQAVSMAKEIGDSKTADQLGISKNSLSNWRKDPANRGGTPNPISLEEENRRLREENGQLKKVNHILKAAAAFFSQDHLK